MSERWRKFQLLVVRFIVWLTQSWLWRKFTLLALRFIVWLDPSLVDRKIRETARAGALKYGRSELDRKSTRLNSSHGYISYAVFCLKKKKIYDLMYYSYHTSNLPMVALVLAPLIISPPSTIIAGALPPDTTSITRTTAQEHPSLLER